MCVLREYLGETIQHMERFIEKHHQRPSYIEFCANTSKHAKTLREYYAILEPITPVDNFVAHMGGVGYMLKCYYESHSNLAYEESLRYSFGFEGFLDNLRGISRHIQAGHISSALFDSNAACDFKDAYYPAHLSRGEQCVKNNCKLDKKLIITGPNASGKTTMLKTTTINVIFTQQVGVGFYAKCVLNPYTHIHSYLNIPDTSERDSLFQAESRRCKTIIDTILDNPAEKGFRHYGIFDELYSGTNPSEASKSAYAFLKYLTKYENVDFILTTHYTSVCSKLKKCEQIRNHKMDVVQTLDGNFEYTYKMKKGISKIQGAVKILESMNYPEEIMNTIKESYTDQTSNVASVKETQVKAEKCE
jgi:DNA mismatch repair ATPase MutS